MTGLASMNVAQIAQELVRIPSVNPMGRDVSGEIYLEGRLTQYLQEKLEGLGLPWERHTVLPGRENLVARIAGSDQAETILLEVHQDTVPVDGMTIPPFEATLEQGRIYGRGSCDIKGGMASMLSAAARICQDGNKRRPNVVLAFTINEENGFDGARHLRELWESGRSQLVPTAPDKVIVAEPTQLNVVTTHKGTVRWRCSTTGRAAHSSDPDLGDNAIYRMAEVLHHLNVYAREVVPSLANHPLLGSPTLSVGLIEGGISVNTVPDRCTITIDRRLLPEESGESAIEQLNQYLESQGVAGELQHEGPFLSTPGLSDHINAELAGQLVDVIRACGHSGERIGVAYGTDADSLSGDDVPAVVFGPGDIAQAHTKDEWVQVEQLESAAEILYRFCCQN